MVRAKTLVGGDILTRARFQPRATLFGDGEGASGRSAFFVHEATFVP